MEFQMCQSQVNTTNKFRVAVGYQIRKDGSSCKQLIQFNYKNDMIYGIPDVLKSSQHHQQISRGISNTGTKRWNYLYRIDYEKVPKSPRFG